ncbi:hypothetical protein XENOCAPTIV_024456, partial [Xenoophorus captivus]
ITANSSVFSPQQPQQRHTGLVPVSPVLPAALTAQQRSRKSRDISIVTRTLSMFRDKSE